MKSNRHDNDARYSSGTPVGELAAALLVVACVAFPAAAADPPPPGTVINSGNVGEWREFFGPGMLWVINRGLELKVYEHRQVEHPPPFRAATEKYSGQVKLSEDGTHLVDHVAGLPFPTVDPTDPRSLPS